MKSGHRISTMAAAAFVFVLSFTAPVRAADHVVHMTFVLTFNPASLQIDAGDTVTWMNDDDFEEHTATSTTGAWNTGDVLPGENATLMFNTPGTYPYRCLYHSNPAGTSGMIGTLVVRPSAPPPSAAVLTNALLLPNGSFRFTLTSLTVGKTNVIEVSTNLADWAGISTNVAEADTQAYTNAPLAGVVQAFYRSYQVP